MTNEQTINALKASGLAVKISHRRLVESPEVEFVEPMTRHALDLLRADLFPDVSFRPTGGTTTVTLVSAEGTRVAEGVAVCHPDESFNKRLGLTVALGRAVKAAREVGAPISV